MRGRVAFVFFLFRDREIHPISRYIYVFSFVSLDFPWLSTAPGILLLFI